METKDIFHPVLGVVSGVFALFENHAQEPENVHKGQSSNQNMPCMREAVQLAQEVAQGLGSGKILLPAMPYCPKQFERSGLFSSIATKEVLKTAANPVAVVMIALQTGWERSRYIWHGGLRVVIPAGLEPATSRLGILRSILMSYGTADLVITDLM